MQKSCLFCQKLFFGRTDKVFCSIKCKNTFNYKTRRNTVSITQKTDSYLHRNREILATLMGDSVKETFDRLVVTRTGFKYEYCTGTYNNASHKTYFLIYDFAWMAFSDQKILVVRKVDPLPKPH